MKIIKFTDFLNEQNNNKPILKYYAFDWDNNILNMPTKIHMLHLINGEWVEEQVSTEKFAIIRNDKENWKTYNNSFIEFRDFGKRGQKAFLEDMKVALSEKNYGPCWNKFKKCLIQGSLFAIITARGHEPAILREAIEYIINNILTNEEKNEMGSNLIGFMSLFNNFDIMKKINFSFLVKLYLDNCDFIAICSSYFTKKHPELQDNGSPINPEKSKQVALKDFIEKINRFGKKINANVKLGFSDDDTKNVESVIKYFNEIDYDINLSVYDTSNPNIQGGKKTIINKFNPIQ
jgi:hypothetical protein